MEMGKRTGEYTVLFENPPSVVSVASIAGPKESEGPLADLFDVRMSDPMFGQTSWEKAEAAFVEEGFGRAVQKAGLKMSDIDYIVAGDLLNQTIASTFGALALERPFFGVYGACANFGEALCLGGVLIDGGFAEHVLAGASSHFCTAERQFRFPLSLGSQRPPTSTWTVTGHGAAVLSKTGDGPYLTGFTAGRMVDLGVSDPSNMGGAMAPAAADVITRHLKDTGRDESYYDLVITGDLGTVGKELLSGLLMKSGRDLEFRLSDCGIEIFDSERQDTHAGGSGCACSALTFATLLYTRLKARDLNRILFVPTGALLSTTSTQQGESIPCIAYAVSLEN
jgi:stage V sporulation protein AD